MSLAFVFFAHKNLKVVYMLLDRFLLAVESHDLSQADKIFIRVSSFPKVSDGSQNFFFCLATINTWTFCKMNPLYTLRFTSHEKNWEDCLLFNLANFLIIKLTKTQILPNFQEPHIFLYYWKCIQGDDFGKNDVLIMLLSAWCRSRDSTGKRSLSNDI